MAITPIAQPKYKYLAAYNPITYIAKSTNVDQLGFKFVFDLYVDGDLANRQYVTPRISDQLGVFRIEDILANYITYNLSGSTAATSIPNSWIDFQVKVGESYSSFETFFDYQFYAASGTTDNGYTELLFDSTHPYFAGSQLAITQEDAGQLNFPQLTGLHVVRLSSSTTSVVVDVPYNFWNQGITVTGTTRFADYSRVEDLGLHTYSAATAINAAVPFITQILSDDYVITGSTDTTQKFLTNLPNPAYQTPSENIYWNLINNYSNIARYLVLISDDGTTYRKDIQDLTEPMLQVEVGPANAQNNATLIAGTAPLIKSDTNWYEVYTTNPAGIQNSERRRINIDRRASINCFTVLFMDRLGSFNSFAMQLKYQDTTQITRQTYNKHLDEVLIDGSAYYSTSDRGITTNKVQLSRNLTLNSNWMTEEQAQYFDELVTSPVIFLEFEGILRAIQVTDNSTEKSIKRNKTLMRKTLNVIMSGNDLINY